ncbi:hypothetical protein ABBQ32_012422 [Trebouxia sp. C0010 RCD-2024]
MWCRARLSADFRRNDADLNFPKADYSLEELPATIAQLAEFIREEQSMHVFAVDDDHLAASKDNIQSSSSNCRRDITSIAHVITG